MNKGPFARSQVAPNNNHSKPEMNTLDNTNKNSINTHRRISIARNKQPRKRNHNKKKPSSNTKLKRRRLREILLKEENVTDKNARIAKMVQSEEIDADIDKMITQKEGTPAIPSNVQHFTDAVTRKLLSMDEVI